MLGRLIERVRRIKQRWPRKRALPDGQRAFIRDVDLCIVDEVYKEKAYGALDEIAPGDTVIDCGAHVGVFTLAAAKRAGVDGHVLAFEPAPQNLKLLRQSVALNKLSNVSVLDCALAGASGQADLYLAPADGNPAANSLKGEAGQSKVRVAVRKLDDVVLERRIARVDLLKIDVEGAELELLAGASRTLNLTTRLVMEIHPLKLDPYSVMNVIESAGLAAKVLAQKPHSWLVQARR